MILFAWSGFPQYAARCVGAFVRQTKEKVIVIGTTPDVPIKGMEELAECPVHWVDSQDKVDIKSLLGEVPAVLIVSGWAVPAFNHIANDIRSSSGKVIVMNDANYHFSLKECLRALRFQLFLRRKFDAFFVPGNAGVELMRFYGVPKDKIVTGMYAADSMLFTDGEELTKRPKNMIYVGRLCERKNVIGLCKAFIAAGGPEKGWTLDLYGCGEQKHLLPNDNPSIKVYDFLQPEELAKVYQSARCFVLPSFEEHWGLVVHEAALSGCLLLLSDRVGSAKDFLSKDNGFTFNPYSLESFVEAMRKVFDLDDNALTKAHEVSLSLSKTKGIRAFVDGVNQLIDLKE